MGSNRLKEFTVSRQEDEDVKKDNHPDYCIGAYVGCCCTVRGGITPAGEQRVAALPKADLESKEER